jgi:hypothetical protein
MEEGYDFNSSGVNDVIFLVRTVDQMHQRSNADGKNCL